MKQLFLSLFLLAFFSCNNHSRESTDIVQLPSSSQKVIPAEETNLFSSLRYFDHLKGRVKSLTSSTFLARKKGSELVKVTLGNSYATRYDAKGNGIEKLYKNSTGKVQTTTSFIADASNKSVKANVFKSSNTLLKTLAFNYNASGLLVEEISTPANGKLTTRSTYIYNKLNQLAEEVKYNVMNKVEMRTTYHYNSTNEIDETNFISPANNSIIHCKSEYSNYDTHGNWLKCIQQTSKGSLFLIERNIEYYP